MMDLHKTPPCEICKILSIAYAYQCVHILCLVVSQKPDVLCILVALNFDIAHPACLFLLKCAGIKKSVWNKEIFRVQMLAMLAEIL